MRLSKEELVDKGICTKPVTKDVIKITNVFLPLTVRPKGYNFMYHNILGTYLLSKKAQMFILMFTLKKIKGL